VTDNGCRKFIRGVVEEVWIKELKDPDTYFHNMPSCDLLDHLKKNALGLHVIDISTLRTKMISYYENAASMPDYILIMEEAIQKAKQAGLPIDDKELVAMALVSLLQSGHFRTETDNWEGRVASNCSWSDWKTTYKEAYNKIINPCKAGARDEPFNHAANSVTTGQTTADLIHGSLNNLALALAATSNKKAMQQLTNAIVTLTGANATLITATTCGCSNCLWNHKWNRTRRTRTQSCGWTRRCGQTQSSLGAVLPLAWVQGCSH
jgi:hypothetical protein